MGINHRGDYWIGSQSLSRGRTLLDPRRSAIAAIRLYGKGRASWTIAEVHAANPHLQREKINQALMNMLRHESVKRLGRGVYRLTGEV